MAIDSEATFPTNPGEIVEPVKIRLHRDSQGNVSKLEKLLIKLKLKPPPLIETKPGVTPESLGRGKVNREQLRQKLQEEPSA